MNCRNVRNEIEVVGSSGFLSPGALAHISGCKRCELTAQQQNRLHAIVANLGVVEAPSDFDFRLRARIAARNTKQPASFSLGIPSWALRGATVAAGFILLVTAFLVAGLRAPVTGPANQQPQQISKAVPAAAAANTPANAVASVPLKAVNPIEPADRSRGSRRESRNELASFRGNRSASRDEASTAAEILKRYDQMTASGTAFPIDASYQNLKLSVDDGTGTARTISLPAVSFGSQRTLSQNVSPVMASNRGTW